MTVHEVRVAGHDALLLTVDLLRRVRLADPYAGLWEAADVCWWWRTERRSDDVEKVFWLDGHGPVAGALLTAWTDERWQADPVVVPGVAGPGIDEVWARAVDLLRQHASGSCEVGVAGADAALRTMVVASGFVPDDVSANGWMVAASRPTPPPPPDGFAVVDRTMRVGAPHPMRALNGEGVGARLAQTPLYSPDLDLTLETVDGRETGYVLCWYDDVTRTGLVEPVRTHAEFQGRGLARTLVTVGIDRLAAKGAQRVKIGWGEDHTAALYQSIGFVKTSEDTYYSSSSSSM